MTRVPSTTPSAEVTAVEDVLWASRDELVRAMVAGLGGAMDEEERARRRDEAALHVETLAIAVGRRASQLFAEHVRWAKLLHRARGGAVEALDAELERLAAGARTALGERAREVLALIEAARARVPEPEALPCSAIEGSGSLATLARRYLTLALGKRRDEAIALIREAASSGTSVRDLFLHVLAPAQAEVGRLWQLNLASVADEHYCTAVAQLAVSALHEHVFIAPRSGRTVVAAAADGELHELGLRMVSDLLELDGWDTIHLGASLPREPVLALVRDLEPDLVALSATLPRGVRDVSRLVEGLRADPRTRAIPVLVGGPPFTREPRLFERVGADATAKDAGEAVEVAARLVERRR